jgi:hypothetical protein
VVHRHQRCLRPVQGEGGLRAAGAYAAAAARPARADATTNSAADAAADAHPAGADCAADARPARADATTNSAADAAADEAADAAADAAAAAAVRLRQDELHVRSHGGRDLHDEVDLHGQLHHAATLADAHTAAADTRTSDA